MKFALKIFLLFALLAGSTFAVAVISDLVLDSREKENAFFSDFDTENIILDSGKVFENTNKEREKREISSFSRNENLDRAAEIKLNDMIEKQYFDHESPSGETAGVLVELTGYNFIAVGENLAKGDFSNEEELVNGWMNSPGHRENILNPGFKEIGIAVAKGVFGGRETWLAVQVFALPSGACPRTDPNILNEILFKQEEAATLLDNINDLRDRIEQYGNAKDIGEYNRLVRNYNNLIYEISSLSEEYNRQVKSTNQCISNYGF